MQKDSSTWHIVDEAYDGKRAMLNGTKFFLGNGYMGYRGTLEEYSKDELCACTLAGVYDQVGDKWREPVNAPNGLYTRLFFANQELSVLHKAPLSHRFDLDLQNAQLTRHTDFESVEITSRRFLSADNIHLIVMQYSFTARRTGKAAIETGIDARIWDINGPHLPQLAFGEIEGCLFAQGQTPELKLTVALAEQVDCDFEFKDGRTSQERVHLRRMEIDCTAGRRYTFTKYVSIYTSLDNAESPLHSAVRAATAARAKGFVSLGAAHRGVWAQRWSNADVRIDGDDAAQAALRYSIYILYSNVPTHTDRLAIPARGLSGQVYKGAMFWDTEIYMMPLFNHTQQALARNLARYRIHTLDGARAKARQYGHTGAFYAWESQETGEDACTDFAVTDVFTGRPLRTHFRDQQIHISADVAYGIWGHYIATGDVSILLEGGAETILECARFLYSYAYFKKTRNRYELLEVTCADEYHERVHNNFYTNIMAKYTLEIAVKVVDLLKARYPDTYTEMMHRLDYEKDLANILEMAKLLYVPAPDENGVIEQFDGYNKLECPTVAELKSRILDPREHLGSPVGLMTETQIIKQADVVLGLLLFSDRYSLDIRRKNWEHYERRCEHGSTLSSAIYAVLAAQIGFTDYAYKFFMKTATIDLTGDYRLWVGDLFIGGTHTAACGGTWIAAVQGFAGFRFDGEKIALSPRLPDKWTSLSFKVACKGSRYGITVSKDEVTVTGLEGKCDSTVSVFGEQGRLENGSLKVALKR